MCWKRRICREITLQPLLVGFGVCFPVALETTSDHQLLRALCELLTWLLMISHQKFYNYSPVCFLFVFKVKQGKF